LRVLNGTDADAVAVLLEDGIPRRAIYIRTREYGLITQVPAGGYTLHFQLGSQWLEERRFCVIAGTSAFERSLDFEERHSDNGVTYTTIDVTLNAVPEGNTRTHPILPTSFALPPP